MKTDGDGGFLQNNFTSSLKSMFAQEDSLKILPTLAEFEEMAKKLAAGKRKYSGLCGDLSRGDQVHQS